MPNHLSTPSSNETFDTLFGGKIRIVQEKGGYRFSIDSILLAGFVGLRRGDKVIDLGTGVGIIPLILAHKGAGAEQFVGVEIQQKLVELAERNVFINGFEALITIYQRDIRGLSDVFLPSSFDVVVTNPPYYRISSGRINPNSQKAVARHEITCTIDDVLQISCYLLKEGGRIFIIFPAQRAVTLLARLRSVSLEPKRIRWIYSREGEEARFILTEAHKGGGEGVEVLPPLFIYSAQGNYTPEMETLYSIPLQIMARKGESK
jgi:tRNA1Val (adenine37-N6)-methyltransferase